jgi:Icc-related predicted phosphoesterase
MIIVAITDLHSDAGRLPGIAGELAAADAVLVTGDITQFGKAAEAKAILDAVRREAKRGAVMLASSLGGNAAAAGPRIFAVAGNCDSAQVEEFLAREGASLHGRHEAVNGVEFAGAGRSLPCPGGGTDRKSVV